MSEKISSELLEQYREYSHKLMDWDEETGRIAHRDDAALDRLFEYAKSHPDNWKQSVYFAKEGVHGTYDAPLRVIVDKETQEPACGTSMCLAGFQTIVFDRISPKVVNQNDIMFANWASFKLGLNFREMEMLFHTTENKSMEKIVQDVKDNKYRDVSA